MPDFMKQWVENRNKIRKHDLDIIFKNVPEKIFKNGLEIGAGDGFQSRILVKYCESLTCTEYNKERLDFKLQDEFKCLKCEICDAENLPFKDNSFDFIFSSNVLEHIPNKKKCLSELNRVLKKDGMMIHVMPNRMYKAMSFLFYYPFILYMLTHKERRDILFKKLNSDTKRNNIKLKDKNILSKLFPPIHGISSNHFTELYVFGKKYWVNLFEMNGFCVRKTSKVSLSSSYRFGFHGLRNIGEKLGLCTFYAYITTKKNSHTNNIKYFLTK